MRTILHPLIAPFLLTAAAAFAQIPAFTIVKSGLETAYSNAGKGPLDAQVAGITGVAFGANLFVIPANSTGEDVVRWATSPDGITWTARTQAVPAGTKSAGVSKVHFLNGKFIFFAGHSSPSTLGVTYVYVSADGLTWTANKVMDSAMNVVEFDASPTLYVASGTNGKQIASSDLVTWTSRPVVSSGGVYSHNDLTYGAGHFITTINGFGGQAYTTTDAVTWTPLPGLAAPGGGFTEAGNGVILLNLDYTNRYRSTDGVNFTKITAVMTPATSPVPGSPPRFAGGRFLSTFFDVSHDSYASSSDGQNWTPFAAFPPQPAFVPGQSHAYSGPLDVAFGNGKYVVAENETMQTLLTSQIQPAIMVLDAPAAPTPPVISSQPAATNAVAGGTATISVAVSGTGNTFQWRKDGTNLVNGGAISGATTATLTISNVAAANAGVYTVVITNAAGSVTSSGATLALVTASNVGRLINMSIRTGAGTGDSTLIVGVTLGGAGTSGSKAVLVRGVGPTLGSFGVPGTLADPTMAIFQGSTSIAQNDDWAGGFDFSAVGAFAYPANARDAAIYNAATPSGSYSVQITGKNNATGIALAEIYDATPATGFSASTPRLINVSARTQVGTGDSILIAGFVIGGSSPVKVLIRAVGPTLGGFGVGGVLADPKLEVYNGTTMVANNDNWEAANASVFTSVGAFALTAGSKDAAVVTTLQPGNYTAQVSGVGNTTGVALVEVYELP